MSSFIRLEQLPHQEAAITKVLDAMTGCLDTSGGNPGSKYIYANPVLNRMHGIDVKMETGTGKTYVYTRLMYELYMKFGINKFIILTPSLAIKEGVKSFIQGDSAAQHFRELYRTQKVNLGVVNAGDFSTKKGKRKQFAGALSDFCEASRNDLGSINALLLNDSMLASKSMTRDDYDQTLLGGSTCPIEALSLTRPIVIIDEPHRFKKDGIAWKNILKLNPQLIIRFGATFPDISMGSGRNKIIKKDYDNLVYNLNSVESFNRGLVKAVNVNFPNLPERLAKLLYRIEKASNTELVLNRNGRQFTVRTGEELSVVDPLFEGGNSYEGRKLSNDLELAPGMILTPGVWGNSYQELILRQAIDAHFENEIKLFHRSANAPRVKTLSLFFIDSIPSYREKKGWLKVTFEKILNEKLTRLIAAENGEYKEYLEATKSSLNSDDQKVHAGYFAEDTGKKGDEAIQSEVDDILRNKESLLQFKDENGNWNIRRFLFSKWTLREGWDNPNIFVLTKLRSSGSEISKIQEVGRGLRLPFDELGNRLNNEEFRLNLIVDYSERDFAQKLIGEINADGGKLQAGKLSDIVLSELVKSGYADSAEAAKKKLLIEDIVDTDWIVQKPDELEKLVPIGVKQGKIRVNAIKNQVVHLRKNNWGKISALWAETSKRYMLKYSDLSDIEIKQFVESVVDKTAFTEGRGRVTQFRTEYDSEKKSIVLTEQTITLEQAYGQLKYGEFLERIHESTSLPINLLHSAIIKVLGTEKNPNSKFNELSLRNLKQIFTQKFIEVYSQKYSYDPLDFTASISIFNSSGQIVDELDQGSVGLSIATDVNVPENYLYEEPAFDSEIEHEILKQIPPSEVLVFGKLPRRSIKVPTFIGGTSSPDFVYAIRKSGSDKIKVNALIEAKGKEFANLSIIEKVALESQTKISEKFKDIKIRLVTDSREVSDILQELS